MSLQYVAILFAEN